MRFPDATHAAILQEVSVVVACSEYDFYSDAVAVFCCVQVQSSSLSEVMFNFGFVAFLSECVVDNDHYYKCL